MAENFIEKFISSRKAKKNSLEWTRRYCDRTILERELKRRMETNYQEVYDFLKDRFLRGPYSIEVIQNLSAFLGISPIEVIEWDNYRLVPTEVEQRFLLDDFSWLESKVVPFRVHSGFLLQALLVDEQFYRYPHLIAQLDSSGKKELLSSPEVDLTKFPKDTSINDLLPDDYFYRQTDSRQETVFHLTKNAVARRDCASIMLLIDSVNTAKYAFEQCCSEMNRVDFTSFIDAFPKEFLSVNFPNFYIESMLYKEDYDAVNDYVSQGNSICSLQDVCRTMKERIDIEEYFAILSHISENLLQYFNLYANEQEAMSLLTSPLVKRLDFIAYSRLIEEIEKNDKHFLEAYEKSGDAKFLSWKQEAFEKKRFLGPSWIFRDGFEEKSQEELLAFLQSIKYDVFRKLDYLSSLFFGKCESNLQIATIIMTNRHLWKDWQVREKLVVHLLDKVYSERDFETMNFIASESSYLFGVYSQSKKEEMDFKDYIAFLDTLPENLLNRVDFKSFSREEKIDFLINPIASRLNYLNYSFFALEMPNEVLDRLSSEENPAFKRFLERGVNSRDLSVDFKYYKSFFEDFSKDHFIHFLRQIRSCSVALYYITLAKEFVLSNEDKLSKSEILRFFDISEEIFTRMANSSSSEFRNHKNFFLQYVLHHKDPLKCLVDIENIFLQNNLPFVGKIFKVVEQLYPVFHGDLPSFKRCSQKSLHTVVFADLLKAAFGSNNRSLIEYLENIEKGYGLFNKVSNGETTYESLTTEERNTLDLFCEHLKKLYSSTMQGSKSTDVHFEGHPVEDIMKLKVSFSKDGTVDYDLPDRIVRMFCHFSGIDTLQGAKEYIAKKRESADARNRRRATEEFVIKRGDMIKGIGELDYLPYLLQNGILAKEFLNDAADSDRTPFDTDVSIVLEDIESEEIDLSKFIAKDFGPIWLVLKKDDRFTDTYDDQPIDKMDFNKFELYHRTWDNGEHGGIRTGFASSEIDYLLVKQYNKRIGLEIAMNGFYIPVFDTQRTLLFSPKDYDALREKMCGLRYYNEMSYDFSSNLDVSVVEDTSERLHAQRESIAVLRSKILEVARRVLKEYHLGVETEITGKLDNEMVELIETGSSKRGTSVLGDYDFDFVVRVDNAFFDSAKFKEMQEKLREAYHPDPNDTTVLYNGDFRLKNGDVDGMRVDVDMSFVRKTNKISYSTDMCLEDRLAALKNLDEGKYNKVLENIVAAKSFLKEAGVYKPNRGTRPEGGLGGVGIENWVLQHGGSFYDAAKSFVEASEGLNYYQFLKAYDIWDFGENHFGIERKRYLHDNFVYNMSEAGYFKMCHVLEDYLKKMETTLSTQEESLEQSTLKF